MVQLFVIAFVSHVVSALRLLLVLKFFFKDFKFQKTGPKKFSREC
jgi:hypothetical protein